MDYESITDEENFRQTMKSELITPAERQEDEESNVSAAKNTRCDWNYVYGEIV